MAQTIRNRSGDKRQATLNVVAVACRRLYKETFRPKRFTSSRAAESNELRATSPFIHSSSLHLFGRSTAVGELEDRHWRLGGDRQVKRTSFNTHRSHSAGKRTAKGDCEWDHEFPLVNRPRRSGVLAAASRVREPVQFERARSRIVRAGAHQRGI